MTSTELCYLTIHEASSLLQSGQLSPVDLTRAFFDRIEQYDSTLKAYITLLPDRAMAAARTAEAELLRGERAANASGLSDRYPLCRQPQLWPTRLPVRPGSACKNCR